MIYPRDCTDTSVSMQLSKVYMDFISQLLSVTITKLQNINFTQEQEMNTAQPNIHHKFLASREETKSSDDAHTISDDDSTMSDTMVLDKSLDPGNTYSTHDSPATPLPMESNLREITVSTEPTPDNSPVMYFQDSSRLGCNQVLPEMNFSNDQGQNSISSSSETDISLNETNDSSSTTEIFSTVGVHDLDQEDSQEYSQNSAIVSAGIDASNMLRLLQSAAFRNRCRTQMEMGVSRNKRDALDMAGKVTLALMAMSVGIFEDVLFLDPAQAGGLIGKSDGAIINSQGHKELIEVKGCKCRKGKKFTVTLKDIRLNGTNFKHLIAVARKRDPDDWTNVEEYGQCDFWLAHVTRVNLMKAMHESGRSHMHKVDATITPGSNRSWLGKYVNWIHFEDLTTDWWMKNVMKSNI